MKQSNVAVVLSRTGGEAVTVVSIWLPAGAWVLSSEATLVNFGPGDFARCVIIAGGTQIASGATFVGGDAGAALVADRGLLGSVLRSTGFRASLRCLHDSPTPAGLGAPYVDPGAVLWAHKSPALRGTTTG